jgi:hypothetical protein
MAKLGDDLRSLKKFFALRANLIFLQPRGYGYAMAKLGDDLRSLKNFFALRANLIFLQPRGYGHMHGNCYGWPLEV